MSTGPLNSPGVRIIIIDETISIAPTTGPMPPDPFRTPIRGPGLPPPPVLDLQVEWIITFDLEAEWEVDPQLFAEWEVDPQLFAEWEVDEPEPEDLPDFEPNQATFSNYGGAFIDENGDLWYSGAEE